MPATPSERRRDGAALRIALSLALAVTAGEAMDLEFTFIAGIVAVALAASPGPRLGALVAVPAFCWALGSAIALTTGALAAHAPLAFLLLVVVAFWAGFSLSMRPGLAVFGLLILVMVAITPMRIFAYPEAGAAAVNDIARNALTGALAVGVVSLALPAAAGGVRLRPVAPLPPIRAACALAFGAWLVWVIEPPAPGAVLVGAVIALRADPSPPALVARDRVFAAVAGGAAAVVAATLIALAPVLPVLFLSLLALSWPMALAAADGGAWRGAGVKSLNALAVLTAEGFSVAFEDAPERLDARIAGVFIGLAFALAVLALLAPARRGAAEARP